MADKMDFPDTVEEFMEQYKVVDTDGVYMSKGSELVPIFRMRQWFEHLPSAQPEKVCIANITLSEEQIREAVEKAKEELKNSPILIEPEPQWIPCSERLPNCNGIYIVTRIMSDGFECRNIVDACYFDGFDTWHDDTRVNHERKYLTDVVAWCELPEPWRGEEHG